MDFDGSGLANSVFYSPYLITVDINWPPSTTNGEKITKAHDAYMLKRLYFWANAFVLEETSVGVDSIQ